MRALAWVAQSRGWLLSNVGWDCRVGDRETAQRCALDRGAWEGQREASKRGRGTFARLQLTGVDADVARTVVEGHTTTAYYRDGT